ncbi:MBL fold metallo-hydrolase [Gordonia sp. DT30]|uniref:MBL fold metallo-hydrolase n=1 Tax=unclassified Gordonia (in: high G+C Gram-positive bacteria) TaxID=2657482 RepID=UPI003CF31481
MYMLDLLVEGFPAISRTHGGLGWSSVSLLHDGQRRVLVETGPPAYIPLLHERLGRLGITADEITHVLVTHLHWDHVGNFTMFPGAQVLVSETEMDWAAAQPPGTTFVPDLHVRELANGRRDVRLVRGDQEVLPGIFSIDTPGHTPGHIAFRTETPTGTVLFAGDSVKNRYELGTETAASTMDAAAGVASIRKLKSLMEADKSVIMVPGHDVPLKIVGGQVTALMEQEADLAVYLNATDDPVRLQID